MHSIDPSTGLLKGFKLLFTQVIRLHLVYTVYINYCCQMLIILTHTKQKCMCM